MPDIATTSLPGIYFLPNPVSPSTALPPLDVAAFVGFAERGPLDRPVALDDFSTFSAIFGGEKQLAQYADGRILTAHLSSSVASFFSNGGRRCYAVRVAGAEASRATLPLPGLKRAGPKIGGTGKQNETTIFAASEGIWAYEKLKIATRLQPRILSVAALTSFVRQGPDFTLLWNIEGDRDLLQPGELLRLTSTTTGEPPIYLLLADVRLVPDGSLNRRLLIGKSLWQATPTGNDVEITELALDYLAGREATFQVARLRFDLLLREAGLPQQTLRDLAFNDRHPRFWGDVVLLESSPLFTGSKTQQANARSAADRYRAHRNQSASVDLTKTADVTGADELAGRLAPISDAERSNVYIPIGMPEVVTEADFVRAQASGADGLDRFPAESFMDPWLSSADATALYANAQDRYWIQATPLKGLHSLMFVDEVAMVALPDAVHPDWAVPIPVPGPPVVQPIPVPPPPQDPGVFACCPPQEPKVAPEQPPQPAPQSVVPVVPVVPIVLSTKSDLPVVQPDRIFDTSGDPATNLLASPLVRIQAELQIFCEARRDLFGILTLPDFYQRQHCQLWLSAFRRRLGLPSGTDVADGTSGLADLSYVGVYHPWIEIADTSSFNHRRAIPADGAACGSIAARERTRNVWVAPANVPLSGVLALTPRLLETDRTTLFQEGFNIVHAEPRDFRIMSAHTLSGRAEWLQISVRRLMILLRKMLLERGNDYVFENNSPIFRTAVQVSLESVLDRLFRNGAFAGKTVTQSYRVSTNSDVNTKQTVDAGQFIAVIEVAPSQPAEFMTVVLVRTDDNLLTATEK